MEDVLEAVGKLAANDVVRIGHMTCYAVKNVGKHGVTLTDSFSGNMRTTYGNLGKLVTRIVGASGKVLWDKGSE